MFEFKKLCDAFEEMSAAERGVMLAEKSVTILQKLSCLHVSVIDPVKTLAGFIVGAVASDGKVNEKEYLLIYPSLVRVFGDEFDYASVKEGFKKDVEGRKALTEYTQSMLGILDFLDDELKSDIITLCLCVTAIDGKVNLREKNYIKRLCKA